MKLLFKRNIYLVSNFYLLVLLVFRQWVNLGKSTLLRNLAGDYSEVATYEFTTLTTVHGCIKYKGAKIQFNLPGIIEGDKDCKGRERQFVVVARTCILIFMALNCLKPLGYIKLLEQELEDIRFT